MELPTLTVENFDEQLASMTTKYLPEWAELLPFGFVLKFSIHKHCKWELQKSVNRINKLMKEIPPVFQKHNSLGRKYWNTSSSYGQKHQLADEIKKNEPSDNGYSNNGEFIFAMMLLGYEMKKLERGERTNKINPNATFNCTRRDLSKVICECGLQYSKNSKGQHFRSKNHHFIITNKHLNETDSQFGDYLDQAIDRLVKN
jgi:hypothetical protein